MSVQAIIAASVEVGKDDAERKYEVWRLASESGLVSSKMTCQPNNKHGAGVQMEIKGTKKVKDAWRWRCSSCKSEKSIKSVSFFQDSNVILPDWIRFIQEWTRHERPSIDQLRNSTAVRIGECTAKSMVKCIREFCDRLVFEYPDEKLGGNGAPVAVVGVGVRCNLGHEILLYIGENSEHLVHNHNGLPIKEGSRIYTDLPALPAAAPNNCIVLGTVDCPIQGVEEKRYAAERWWRTHRGVMCVNAHGVVAEFTVRNRYFRGPLNRYAPLFQPL